MKTLTLGLVAFWALAAAACSSGSGIGKTCAQNIECGGALICITQATGGYCTQQPCSPSGAQGGCPDDSICDAVSILAGQLACLKKCKQQSDCRADQECNGVSGSSAKACQPKKP